MFGQVAKAVSTGNACLNFLFLPQMSFEEMVRMRQRKQRERKRGLAIGLKASPFMGSYSFAIILYVIICTFTLYTGRY